MCPLSVQLLDFTQAYGVHKNNIIEHLMYAQPGTGRHSMTYTF